jgi:hypothetical protein
MFKFMEICKFKNVETAKMWLNSLYGKNALKSNELK